MVRFLFLSLGIFLSFNLLAQPKPLDSASVIASLDTGRLTHLPQYPGGQKAFTHHLSSTYRLPRAALAAGVSGLLVAAFVVEKDGSMSNILILKDLGYGTGEEFKRVLRNCKKWSPGIRDGHPVRVSYSLPLAINMSPNRPDFFSNSPAVLPKVKKLPPLEVRKERYYFSDLVKNTGTDDFYNEEGKQALSDRYSVVNFAAESFAPDSLKKISGRISYQILVDSAGKSSTLSWKNESNLPDNSIAIDKALHANVFWNLLPDKKGKRGPVSVLISFTFSEDKIKYQHFALGAENNLLELEFSEKNKLARK